MPPSQLCKIQPHYPFWEALNLAKQYLFLVSTPTLSFHSTLLTKKYPVLIANKGGTWTHPRSLIIEDEIDKLHIVENFKTKKRNVSIIKMIKK